MQHTKHRCRKLNVGGGLSSGWLPTVQTGQQQRCSQARCAEHACGTMPHTPACTAWKLENAVAFYCWQVITAASCLKAGRLSFWKLCGTGQPQASHNHTLVCWGSLLPLQNENIILCYSIFCSCASAYFLLQDVDAGLGLSATSALRHNMSHPWLGRRVGSLLLRGAAHQTVTVAAVPLDLALTAESARQDPQLGPSYAELMDMGLLDERNAVIVMLLVEKMRGDGSRYAPYIQLLPGSLCTPLWFDQQQLGELAGTTLAAATAARHASLARCWGRLQPAVSAMLKQVGVSAEPTLDDFKWATSIFWSRGLGLPVPVAMQQQQQQQQQDAAPGSSSSSSSSSVRIETLEGLVPGLDFANHSQQPRCWWEVEEQKQQQKQQQLQQQAAEDGGQQPVELAAAAAAASSTGPGYAVQLVTNRACCPKVGEELTISYGDKGNEELLLLYGFALPANPHESLMLLCPLPPVDDWDEAFTARVQLLQARGLMPQLFLSAAHLASHQQAAAAKGSCGTRRRGSIIPAAAREVLEVFVMQKRELFAALQGAEEQQQSAAASSPTAAAPAGSTVSSSSSSSSSSGRSDNEGNVVDEVQARIEALGMSMAVLTTFVRLLELKVIQMEGEEGTGRRLLVCH
ncbi:hypothetical protein COO60DRAFT_266676 [Scenedesmus sp. NREL 46B-D3]|nr:hypothetical protein COO60DRAFT_266676 [Scenedesmus sp. NREL 46B-D3]